MPTLLHPGVYVSEVPSGAHAIEGAPTSTAIFVGETERGPLTPTKLTSRTDFERAFGGYYRAGGAASPPDDAARVLMPYAIDGFYLNGGSTAYILRACEGTANAATRGSIAASSPGVWGNSLAVTFLAATGGDSARFRIVVVYDSPAPGSKREIVEVWDRLSTDPADENYVVEVLERSLFVNWAAGAAVTAPALDTVPVNPKESDIINAAVDFTGGTGGATAFAAADYPLLLKDALEGIDDAALLVAACEAMFDDSDAGNGTYATLVGTFIDYAEGRARQDLFFVGDVPSQHNRTGATAATSATVGVKKGLTGSDFAGLYWPHLQVGDVAGVGKNPTITLPPAGYVAGLFARIDGRRGVWKAPAGTAATLNSTIALDFGLTDLHSDDLNPAGINALRQIPGAGHVVWGARTMLPTSEYRYVPVRRTAIFLRTSIYNGIQWAVFEPNDAPLWASLKASIGSFMNIQFRNGAFAGRTSDEAYLVKVDAETTTPADQAAGIVNILVAFAPLRPAEFVVVKLSQKTQPTA